MTKNIKKFTFHTTVRLTEEEVKILAHFKEKLGLGGSCIIRLAVRQLGEEGALGRYLSRASNS